MDFNRHSDLEGKHAFLSPSQYHWLNYDVEKLEQRFFNYKAAERGTRLHSLACELISLGIKLPRTKATLNQYVNDAISYRMIPEQPLYFSQFCFGTADAISFEKNLLRIHDLKTGITPAKMEQLAVYAALFCLEYDIRPGDIRFELRIYQMDEVYIEKPESDEIVPVIDKIVTFDKRLKELIDI